MLESGESTKPVLLRCQESRFLAGLKKRHLRTNHGVPSRKGDCFRTTFKIGVSIIRMTLLAGRAIPTKDFQSQSSPGGPIRTKLLTEEGNNSESIVYHDQSQLFGQQREAS